jgi:hypothetical protein
VIFRRLYIRSLVTLHVHVHMSLPLLHHWYFILYGRFDFHYEAVLTWGRFDWKSTINMKYQWCSKGKLMCTCTCKVTTNFVLIRHILSLLSINTPGFRAHETVAGTKNVGADKKKKKTKQSRCRFTIHFITIKIWLWRLYFMHSYCMKLFHCKNLLCLRKERLLYRYLPCFLCLKFTLKHSRKFLIANCI